MARSDRTPLAMLTLEDLGDIVGDLMKDERKKILEHVERRAKLIEIKLVGADDTDRSVNLHRRITQLESEVRGLTRALKAMGKQR